MSDPGGEGSEDPQRQGLRDPPLATRNLQKGHCQEVRAPDENIVRSGALDKIATSSSPDCYYC